MDTRRSCLVVVDVQRDYFSTDGKCATKFGWDLHEADATAAAIGAFVESVRGKIDIVFLMNEERTDGYAPNLAPVLPEDQLCLIGTPGHELYRVSAAPEDAIITKNHPSGFYAPRWERSRLEAYLLEHGKTSVVIVGGFTSRCVHATLLGALDRGFDVTLLSDLVANPPHLRSEQDGTMSLVNFMTWHGIMTSGDFLRRLGA